MAALLVLAAMIAPAFFAKEAGAGSGLPFPAFGKGPVDVRLYASYFCGPCRMLEPELEPVLSGLAGAGKIRVVFVDLPVSGALPYIRYFLYALNENRGMENAFRVRHVLFDVAKAGGGEEEIREAFEKEGIAFEPFDPEPVFVRFNQFFQEDEIRSTPSAVIIKNGESKIHTGGGSVLDALKSLKNAGETLNESDPA